MPKYSLTLCMIVRDEEETVGRAIKSALAVVDDLVVVDTGSTDNTRLIVEGYGARVLELPWNEDFSAARNAALAAAYGDWILMLDADEVLAPVRPVELGRLLGDEEALAYTLRVRQREGGRGVLQDQIRLFRNHPEARYRLPVHETIRPALEGLAGKLGGRILPSGLEVHHRRGDGRPEQDRRRRNLCLLRRALEADPGDLELTWLSAREQAVHLDDEILPVKGFRGVAALVERVAEELEAMPPTEAARPAWGAALHVQLARTRMACGLIEGALEAVERGLERHGETSLLRFTHGVCLAAAADVDEATAEKRRLQATLRLESMLEGPRAHEPDPVRPEYFGLYPRRYLGLVALQDGRKEDARECFQKALEEDPGYGAAWCGLALLARSEGRWHDALQIYLKALQAGEETAAAWLGGAEVLLHLGFGDNAASWLHRLAALLPEHPRLPEVLARLDPARHHSAVGA